jgi:ADP-dependent NAD(P)H-hydrate dehydratase / NAD(P)H-hydrate epimerase
MQTKICSKKDWLKIKKPKPSSHKGQNGKLLICAGSKKYHGALILSTLAAARFCDLVYAYTNPENKNLIQELKKSTPNVIVLDKLDSLTNYDTILVGPGWENSKKNKSILNKILKTKIPLVLDATALTLLNPEQLSSNVLITPHRGEFESLFNLKPNLTNISKMAKKHRCAILCKGSTDYICSQKECKKNNTHHVGMTKGGSGDILAGLCSALVASHNNLYLCACASTFLIGYSGQRLSKSMGNYYSSQDLLDQLPFSAYSIESNNSQ